MKRLGLGTPKTLGNNEVWITLPNRTAKEYVQKAEDEVSVFPQSFRFLLSRKEKLIRASTEAIFIFRLVPLTAQADAGPLALQPVQVSFSWRVPVFCLHSPEF